jgi:hypothetical protein
MFLKSFAICNQEKLEHNSLTAFLPYKLLVIEGYDVEDGLTRGEEGQM